MRDTQSLLPRLEAYLDQLADIHRRWSEWLAGHEVAVVGWDRSRMAALESTAAGLFAELKQLVDERQSLLRDAHDAGVSAGDVGGLARSLESVARPSLRMAVEGARQRMAQLRRLHAATWLLVHHSLDYCNGTLRILAQGEAQSPVYLNASESSTGGGRLLDERL